MLEQITIENFKCFKHQIIPLGSLNLFTGFNAAGKSTAIQSLLLTSQLEKNIERRSHLLLNGKALKLGTVGEVLCHRADKKEISFKFLGEKNKSLYLHLDASARGKNSLELMGDSEVDFNLLDNLNKTIYIGAARSASLDVFPVPESPTHASADVGEEGQFAPWLFDIHSDDIIDEKKCHPNQKSASFRKQFEAWAGDIFPGAEANSLSIDKAPLVRLELRKSIQEDWSRPANIGYGLSYAFPIIVAGLLAREGQILIVDSPEAHLHPLGQSKIGSFLATIASSGVQVILETHSDHVLNGVRIAVAKERIPSELTKIYFFGTKKRQDGRLIPNLVNPQIDKHGSLSEWPEGFFDQSESDLSTINGWI